ncbi:MAG: fluoride efflux transporter CrcB [Aureispira sp.]
MLNWVAVFVGGGLGSLCRYSLSQYMNSTTFPWATLMANGLACLVLGLVTGYSSRYGWSAPWKLLAATGFCGGFSTFSTFSGEAFVLGEEGLHWSALAYVFISLFLGLSAFYIGLFWSNNNSV